MNVKLAERVLALASTRQKYDEAKAELAALQAAWQAEHAELIEHVDRLRNQVAGIEATIRAYPVSAEERKPAPGLSVRMTTQLRYDQGTARDWAIENGFRNLLALDRPAFEKAALGLKPHFVLVEQVPTISISRDLSQARDEIMATLTEGD